MTFSFQVDRSPGGESGPRTGRVQTGHGAFRTPAFMPVGTLATVKTLLPGEVAATGAEVLLVNAYHLSLRPGHELIARLGGVHRFMDWPGPILSDSGGYQVFSLARLLRIDESGVRFRSHHDGSEHHYTPELAMEVQRALGVDIAMPLDQVVGPGAPEAEVRLAAERTVRWYERSRRCAADTTAFAIVQGGLDLELRRRHASQLVGFDPPGYAIGGLSVGESKDDTWRVLQAVVGELPAARPRYLMGVGSPEELVRAVGLGVDMFDCVLPTRLGRTGSLFTDTGRVNIRNATFAGLPGPLDPACDAVCCTRFSGAYLHHLFRNDELLAYRLATIHNLRYLGRLMERLCLAIEAAEFDQFAAGFLGRYRPTGDEARGAALAQRAALPHRRPPREAPRPD